MSEQSMNPQPGNAAPRQGMIGRRALLRAAIITVPVVAAFSRNAWAATNGCPPGCVPCAHSACLPSGCIQSGKSCNMGQCQNFKCTFSPLRSNELRSDQSSMESPFDAKSPSLTDGGFNNNPWQ